MTRLRRRDLDSLKLSKACRADMAELVAIRADIDAHYEDITRLSKRRAAIWQRRLAKGDLFQGELARLSGVTSNYVARVVKSCDER